MCHHATAVDDDPDGDAARCDGNVPKVIDYSGRFAFFEEACFALVRDHGVDHLSRHRLAGKLGTSISTVRRLLRAEADLRTLALSEVRVRRQSDRLRPPPGVGVDAALARLRRLLPDSPARIAEELVWWRLAIAAPTHPALPLDPAHVEEGPLHHRFAVANLGYVPGDVLGLRIAPPTTSAGPDGDLDRVVEERLERDTVVAEEVTAVLHDCLGHPREEALKRAGQVLHGLVDGLGIAVCLGRVAPEDAVAILRSQLERLTSGGSSSACP